VRDNFLQEACRKLWFGKEGGGGVVWCGGVVGMTAGVTVNCTVQADGAGDGERVQIVRLARV
jgi:hypothetical protein